MHERVELRFDRDEVWICQRGEQVARYPRSHSHEQDVWLPPPIMLCSIRMTRLALPLLETAPEGGVLFMSSAVALVAVPGFAVYAATKAALHSLARSLRAELKSSRIHVFEVLPPVVDTEPVHRLDVPKIPPSLVVDAILAGLASDQEEIRVARVKQLALLARLAPSLADRIVVRALRPSPTGTS